MKVYKTNSYIRNERGDSFPPFSCVLMSDEDKNRYSSDVLQLIEDTSGIAYKVYSINDPINDPVDSVNDLVDDLVDDPVDLESLTKAELVQYAKDRFNADLEVASKKDDLIAEIQLLNDNI